MKSTRFLLAVGAALTLFLSALLPGSSVQAATYACKASTSSAGYSVTVCFTAPASGSALSGAVTVSATATVSTSSPTIAHMIFYLNGAYLLTDYHSPFTFVLPTTRWVDGTYTLGAQAVTTTGFTTATTPQSVTFKNGITSQPVNNNKFTPVTGTTPASGAPFVVMAAGDGSGGEANESKVVTLIQNNNPNLFLYLGDVYEKGSPVEFYNYYGVNGAFFSHFRAITDPTIGNHEYQSYSGKGYFDYWNNAPSYYSFNAGGWHFISLNSNGSQVPLTTTSAQYTWLQNDLAAHASACTIVFYHHPYFDIGPEGPTTALKYAWALMAQYHVTLVLNGHDHDYQRWKPLDGSGNLNSTGITEFVAGGGGHGIQTISKTDSRVAYSNSKNPDAYGVLKLSLSSKSASFSYLSITGAVLDSGTVSCK